MDEEIIPVYASSHIKCESKIQAKASVFTQVYNFFGGNYISKMVLKKDYEKNKENDEK